MGRGLLHDQRDHRADQQCVYGGIQHCGYFEPAGVCDAFGVANGAAVITGKTVGEGSRARVQKVANTLLLLAVAVSVVNCVFLLLVGPLFLNFYHVTPETREAPRR